MNLHLPASAATIVMLATFVVVALVLMKVHIKRKP